MKYIKGNNIVICDECNAHVLIEDIKQDTFESWNFNHKHYNRYCKCPCCENDIFIDNID